MSVRADTQMGKAETSHIVPKHSPARRNCQITTAAAAFYYPAIVTTAAPTTEPTHAGERKSTKPDRTDSTRTGCHPSN